MIGNKKMGFSKEGLLMLVYVNSCFFQSVCTVVVTTIHFPGIQNYGAKGSMIRGFACTQRHESYGDFQQSKPMLMDPEEQQELEDM